MELELGLKIVRDADEFSSSADFMLAKDRGGPLFISTESETMFILTAHLRGYGRENIKIEINEDGSRIIIRGDKFVQETVMVGWQMRRKETVKREFNKAFKIPQGVNLDKIKAKFDDYESTLTISIPKKVKGIRGLIIEEVKEPEIARAGSETLQIVPGDIVQSPKAADVLQEKEAELAEPSGFPEENSAQVLETAPNAANPEEARNTEVHNVQEEEMKETQPEQNGRLLQKESSSQDLVETDTIEEMENSPGEGGEEAAAKAPDVDMHATMEDATESENGSQITEEKLGGEPEECPHSGQEIAQEQNDLGGEEAAAKAPDVDMHATMEDATESKNGSQITEEKLGGEPEECPHSGQEIAQEQNDLGGEEAAAKAPDVDMHATMEDATESKNGSQITEEKLGGEPEECPHSGQEIAQDQNDLNENISQEDEEAESGLVEATDHKAQSQESMPSRSEEEKRSCKICIPIFAGSALLLSLVAFVIHYLRTRSQPGRRNN